MKKREAQFGMVVRSWIKANASLMRTSGIELKDTRGATTFKLSEFKEAQENFAEAITNSPKGVLIRTEGVEGLPDYIYIKEEPSFVVIRFPEGFVFIGAGTLSLEKTRAKSLNWKRAQELAHTVVTKKTT